ncbi:MAG TPA: hypothetical protein VFU73_00325 [Actinocrinis sp.]|nr:hypothetical protein [Actinocrinis sp.]
MPGMLKRAMAGVVTAAVLSTVGANAASATTAKPTTVAVNMSTTSASARQQIVDDLRAGDTITFAGADGQAYSAKLVGQTVAVSQVVRPGTAKPMYSPCTVAVSAGLFAIGAAALGVLAVFSGGITVAGVFIAAETLGQLAAIAGSFAALESFVALYVC